MKIKDRITHAWNAFTTRDLPYANRGHSSIRPMHKATAYYNSSSYVASIFNRIAIDASMTGLRHVKVTPNKEEVTDMNTGLNTCLTVEANIDQTHMQLLHDIVYSMFDEGVVAVVPVDTTVNPEVSGSYDIDSMRVGKIVGWFPKHVEVSLYNDNSGQNENIIINKRNVAIIENPLFAVVNDRNSTLQRLIGKLNQLDDMDSITSSRRLDVLISVPYKINSEMQRRMAEKRIRDIETQLTTGNNGIAYIDGTEKATQLNRPVNSQLMENIKELKSEFYNQLGLTENVFNGTASESELRIYYSRTIDPIMETIISEYNRKFLTKTARTQGQVIQIYRDMFKTVTAESLANLGDSFRRNYVATPNEIRRIAGMRPSSDPRADELFNPNIADNKQMEKGSLRYPKNPRKDPDEIEEEIEENFAPEEEIPKVKPKKWERWENED